jgi:hypothetical protein
LTLSFAPSDFVKKRSFHFLRPDRMSVMEGRVCVKNALLFTIAFSVCHWKYLL